MDREPELAWYVKRSLRSLIVALNLPEIGDRVYTQIYPEDTVAVGPDEGQNVMIAMPAVILSTEGEIEQDAGGDTGNTAWWLPVRVFIVDMLKLRRHTNERIYLRNRKRLIDATHQQLLSVFFEQSDVEKQYPMEVVPQVIFDPAMPQYNHVICGILVRVLVEEPRSEPWLT